MSYWEYYDEDEENIDLNNIKFVHQLRHYSNVVGDKEVRQHLGLTKNEFNRLKYSNIHGKTNIEALLKKPFNEKYADIEYLQEQADEQDYAKYKARLKNEQLIGLLEEKRTDICTIGTNKLKRRLSKIGKTNELAAALRSFLDIEDINIQAKKYYAYSDKLYSKKTEFLGLLIEKFQQNDWLCGHQYNTDNPNIPYIYFFELPICEQVSWHCEQKFVINEYEKKWDGKINSTLDKIENAVETYFPEVIY